MLSPGVCIMWGMPDTFDPTSLSPSVFDARIEALEKREDSLNSELVKVSQELAWWRKGRDLFVAGEEPESEALENHENGSVDTAAGKSVELVPSSDVLSSPGVKPTLRQAILRSMFDRKPVGGREIPWAVPMVISELESRGWAPGGKNAENMVRHMMGDMVKRGQLVRPGYGKYTLSPDMRAARLDAGGDES